jgi:hypothetical protein
MCEQPILTGVTLVRPSGVLRYGSKQMGHCCLSTAVRLVDRTTVIECGQGTAVALRFVRRAGGAASGGAIFRLRGEDHVPLIALVFVCEQIWTELEGVGSNHLV